MKFAKNRLYIEKYVKCPNCGILIFEDAGVPTGDTLLFDGKLYCSAWCVKWEAERATRRATEGIAH